MGWNDTKYDTNLYKIYIIESSSRVLDIPIITKVLEKKKHKSLFFSTGPLHNLSNAALLLIGFRVRVKFSDFCFQRCERQHLGETPQKIWILASGNDLMQLKANDFQFYGFIPFATSSKFLYDLLVKVKGCILPETNIFAPDNRPGPKRRTMVFQPWIFRGFCC